MIYVQYFIILQSIYEMIIYSFLQFFLFKI